MCFIKWREKTEVLLLRSGDIKLIQFNYVAITTNPFMNATLTIDEIALACQSRWQLYSFLFGITFFSSVSS